MAALLDPLSMCTVPFSVRPADLGDDDVAWSESVRVNYFASD